MYVHIYSYIHTYIRISRNTCICIYMYICVSMINDMRDLPWQRAQRPCGMSTKHTYKQVYIYRYMNI